MWFAASKCERRRSRMRPDSDRGSERPLPRLRDADAPWVGVLSVSSYQWFNRRITDDAPYRWTGLSAEQTLAKN
jgi:hypothetical protein